MEHRIVSRCLRDVVAEAHSAMVTVDYATGKPQRVPDEVRQAIASLEQICSRS
jgi:acyl-CoA thioesterase FadM